MGLSSLSWQCHCRSLSFYTEEDSGEGYLFLFSSRAITDTNLAGHTLGLVVLSSCVVALWPGWVRPVLSLCATLCIIYSKPHEHRVLKRKGESPIETIDDINTSKMLTVCFAQYFRVGCANLNTPRLDL